MAQLKPTCDTWWYRRDRQRRVDTDDQPQSPPPREALPEEIAQSLDEAIAGLTMNGQEAQALQASAELRAHEAAVQPTIAQAIRATAGAAGPQDRLAAAYASSSAEGAGGGEQ